MEPPERSHLQEELVPSHHPEELLLVVPRELAGAEWVLVAEEQ